MKKKSANKTLYISMLVVLLSCAGIALPYPILAPLFISSSSGIRDFGGFEPKILLGIALAVYPLGALIGSSILGAASDIYGRKKVLTITLGFSIIGYGLSALALMQENYLLFVLTRLLTGFCEGNIAIAKAIASDLSPVLDKTKTFSLINASGYTGWLIGPLVGGLLQPYGDHIAFGFAAISIALACIAVTLWLTNEQPKPQKKSQFLSLIKKENSLGLLKDNAIRRLLSLYLIVTLGVSAFTEFNPLWLVEQLQFTSTKIGLITATVTGMMILFSSIFVARIKEKLGINLAISISIFLLSGLLLAHPAFNDTNIWYFYGLIGVVMAVYNSLLPVFISERFNYVGQGKLMGLLTATTFFANMVMALLGSVIALLGTIWPIVFGGVLILISGLWFQLEFSAYNKEKSEDTNGFDKENIGKNLT